MSFFYYLSQGNLLILDFLISLPPAYLEFPILVQYIFWSIIE